MSNFTISKDGKKYTSKDDLVEAYECADGSWRVAYYPFADKDRNLTKGKALSLAVTRYSELINPIQESSHE